MKITKLNPNLTVAKFRAWRLAQPFAEIGRPANDDMVEGYLDGRNPDCPEPSGNRSHSYRHGFANGRAEIENRRLGSLDQVIKMADAAMAADEGK